LQDHIILIAIESLIFATLTNVLCLGALSSGWVSMKATLNTG